MKTKFLLVFFALSFQYAISQTITWSPVKIEPKERDLYSGLDFPGIVNNQYLVKEYDAGGISFSRKVKAYLLSIDISTLKVTREAYLNEAAGGKTEDKQYLSFGSFIHQHNNYSFFANRNDKGVYNLLSYIQDGNGKTVQAVNPFVKVDVGKLNTGDKFQDLLLPFTSFNLKPTYDGKSIIGAHISEARNNDYSMLTVSEYNHELKSTVSNTYKIPYKVFQKTSKTIMGPLPTGDVYPPSINQLMKDENGYIYVHINSANPDKSQDPNRNWICQFKLSDPGFQKIFRQEIIGKISPVEMQLFQGSNGTVYVSNIGREIENSKHEDETYEVNSVFVGQFGADGKLNTILSKRLSNEMMYHFEKAKTVDKRGCVNSLSIENILPTSDGGLYIIWQNEDLELLPKAFNYQNMNNVLVQYYSNSKKLAWEKPVYKRQKIKSGNLDFTGTRSFLFNDELIFFYSDHNKNAELPVDNAEVEEQSLVYYSSKDAGGFFIGNFTKAGNFTRKYIHFPEDRMGSVLYLSSLIHLGNKEFIGTTRKMSKVKAEEYSFFKLKM